LLYQLPKQSLVDVRQNESEKSPTGKTPEERAKAFLQWAESHSIIAPPLSENAISRESIYADREDSQL
jgi:hypothetical protein